MSDFCHLLYAVYDLNKALPATVTREAVLRYIDHHDVDHPPYHPTSAIAWDLIRTFGPLDGRRLLRRATLRWDRKPISIQKIVLLDWPEDYEPGAWVDEYLADALAE